MPKQTDKTAEQGAAAVRETSAGPQVLYNEDFGSWALKQAEALKDRDLNAIDWDNLIEELEFLAKTEPRKTWVSQCTRNIQHMLKIEHWDDDEHLDWWVNDWMGEIEDYREHMREAVQSKTVMKGQLDEMLQEAWSGGVKKACKSLRARYLKTKDPELKQRTLELEQQAEEKCPWRLVEVAGYNPRTQDEKMKPSDDVWPPKVAVRLNQVIDPPPADRFHMKGWKAGPMGTILKRGGRVRQGLVHDLPVAEPDRQVNELERDLGPSR